MRGVIENRKISPQIRADERRWRTTLQRKAAGFYACRNVIGEETCYVST